MTTQATSTFGIYTVESFTGNGTAQWTVPSTITSVEVLVVGAGASGWNERAAPSGGYAGWGPPGAVYEGTKTVSGSYTITIGQGGLGYLSNYFGYPGSGGSSSIGTLASALGGTATFRYYGAYAGLSSDYWGIILGNIGGGGLGYAGRGIDGIVLIRYITPRATLTTEDVTLLTSTTLTCHGTVTALTAGHIDRQGFCYKASTTTDPTTSDSVVYTDGSFGLGSFTKAVTGLSAGTAYRFASYGITNAGVTTYGNVIQVITVTTGFIDAMEYSSNALAQAAYVSNGAYLASGVSGKLIGGYHFRKEIPNTESHVLVQSTKNIFKSDNTSEIPNQDTFSNFITLPTANYVNFSEAPDQSMIACDGYTNYVYSGNEYRVAKFINFAPDGTFSYDYTDVVNNNLTDSDNIATLYTDTVTVGSGTKLLLNAFGTEGSQTILDTSAGAKTVTVAGQTYIDTTTYPTAGYTGSLKFDGTGDYLTLLDSADWYMAADPFTISFWMKESFLATDVGFCGQYTGTSDYWYFSMSVGLYGIKTFTFTIKSTTVKALYIWTTSPPDYNSWKHVELVRNGTNVYLFINGISKTPTITTAISTNEVPNLAAVLTVGAGGATSLAQYVMYGNMAGFEVIKGTASHTENFTPPTVPNGLTGASCYVGSTRPITGAKFYVSTPNTGASSAKVFYWGGSSFVENTTVSDGTATGGATLAKTGTISFDTTLGSCKVKAINENVAYYYRFDFVGIDSGVKLSQVSLQTPVQKLVDIWDGSPRQIYAFLKYTTVYSDLTSNVYKLDYYATDTTTYAQIGALTSAQYLYGGFNERLLGMKIYFGETSVNTTVAIMSIDTWSGSAWVNVGSLDDGTSVTNISANRTGVVTWNPPSVTAEYTKSVGNSSQWYFYRISFNATLSADVRIDNITGIPAQVELPPYRYPVIWQNRLWLLNDQSKNKNTAIGSAYGTVCVFNGLDSPKLTFGGTQEVMCAAPLFTRYGGSIYENLVVCKRNQTYLVDGTSPTTYIVYTIANSVGCVAPQTMKVCDTGYEVAPGLTKHVVVWLSSAGVVMFDANAVINISADISDRFDPTSANYINTDIVEKFTAFYDSKRTTYHIQIATGTSTTLNEEWAYDLTRRKWYYVFRGTKYITCGFDVEDGIGNKYSFGGTDDGFIEYLENGFTFDGIPVTYIFRLPDGILDKSLTTVKEVRRIKLTGKANTTLGTVTVRHYGNGSSVASIPAIASISQNVVGKRVYQIGRSITFRNVLHSFEFEITTSDSSSGFNPLFVSGFWRVIREDWTDGE